MVPNGRGRKEKRTPKKKARGGRVQKREPLSSVQAHPVRHPPSNLNSIARSFLSCSALPEPLTRRNNHASAHLHARWLHRARLSPPTCASQRLGSCRGCCGTRLTGLLAFSSTRKGPRTDSMQHSYSLLGRPMRDTRHTHDYPLSTRSAARAATGDALRSAPRTPCHALDRANAASTGTSSTYTVSAASEAEAVPVLVR